MNAERWKQVNNRIYISNYGRVYDKQTNKIYVGKDYKNGYLRFKRLRYVEPVNSELIHRWVAYYFCKGYKEGLEVNHKDGDRHNNHYSNLEWCTRKYNIRHTIKRGTHNVSKAQQEAKIKNCKPIFVWNDKHIYIFPSAKEADNKLGTYKISRVANGGRKTSKGYRAFWL